MSPLPGTPSRAVLGAALLSLTLAAPLHAAAPREAGRRAVASQRIAQPRPQLHLVPGQPVRFPRELLPHLLREFEADIEEAGEEPAHEPRELAGLEHASRPIIGTNRLVNDPTGQPPGSTQSENTIAAHGRYLVAGWNESFDPGTPRSFSGFGYSSDGGKTWTDGGTLPHAISTDFTVGDPSLTVDDDGNFYYASLYSPDGAELGASVCRGRFRGNSFSFGPPVYAGRPGPDSELDKEWIAADPENGTLYLGYTRIFLTTGRAQIELVRSRDRGRTWTAPLVLTDSALESPQGVRPLVGPDHEVYAVYASLDLSSFTFHMRIRKSMNGGRRFGPAVNVGEGDQDPGLPLNVVTGPPGFNRPGGVEFPSIAVGRGDDGGNVYVAWPEAVDFFSDFLGYGGVQAETESNNLPGSATPFTLGDALTGTFASSTDADWFSFSGHAGQTVEFFLTPPPGGTADGFLRLFARNGATDDRLAFSYFGGGQAFILFTLPSDGTYFIRALPINPSAEIGDYFLFTGLHQPSANDVARDARDVMISRSSDGVHWTRRAVVNHDPPRFDNAFPEVAVDGRGDVHLVWYDHRNDAAAGILTDLYYSRSRDQAGHFESDRRVNDGPPTNWNIVPSRLAPNMGDYIALTADGGTVYANWAEGRLGSPDSWMTAINVERDRERDAEVASAHAGPVADEAAISTGRVALSVGNPVRRGTPVAVSFELPRAGYATVEIYSVTGQRVRTLVDGRLNAGAQRVTWNARGRDGATVGPGVYFVVLRTPEARLARRVVLIQ